MFSYYIIVLYHTKFIVNIKRSSSHHFVLFTNVNNNYFVFFGIILLLRHLLYILHTVFPFVFPSTRKSFAIISSILTYCMIINILPTACDFLDLISNVITSYSQVCRVLRTYGTHVVCTLNTPKIIAYCVIHHLKKI